MKIKALLIAISFALLSGCASLDKSMTCTEGTRQILVEDNARLVEREKELKRYQAGEKIPGENYTLFPSRQALLDALIQNYNQHYDQLVKDVEHFNNLCTKK